MKAALLVSLIALLAAPAGADGRVPFTSRALGFSATFPFEVKEHVDPEGGGTAASVDPRGMMYMVGLTPSRPEVARTKSVKQQLDDGMAGALERVKGKVVSQKDVKLGEHPGRETEIALEGGQATFRAYIVGPRVYLVGVVRMNQITLPMSPAEFFASFKLEKKK
jgi:hypothetical protein